MNSSENAFGNFGLIRAADEVAPTERKNHVHEDRFNGEVASDGFFDIAQVIVIDKGTIQDIESGEGLLQNGPGYDSDGSSVADGYALPTFDDSDDSESWKDMSKTSRFHTVVRTTAKLLALTLLMYIFVCSLGLLASAFRLLGGRTAGKVFRESDLLQNPVAGLMMGVLATVLLQSSSASTSILVSMVASGIVSVRSAIPIVMGANIGTSLTNTLVSVAHSGNRGEFRRAFAGATVHDMFNWMSVFILLPIEVITGYLYIVTGAIIRSMNIKTTMASKPPKLLKVLTEPLTKLIIQLDKSVVKKIATGELLSNDTTASLIKHYCLSKSSTGDISLNESNPLNTTSLIDSIDVSGDDDQMKLCKHIFAGSSLDNTTVGLILLLVSLGCLVLCLILVVKLLHSMLSGKVAVAIRKTVNSDLPYVPFLTGYVTIAAGALMTILLQSSSVFTSALTPLVGVGVLSLDRMYPLTLGSNVGTTFTSVLAALASPPQTLPAALQISLCHVCFNLSGIMIFYPVPFMRQFPIGLAKILGNTTAKYRWFVILYVVMMFGALPAAVFGLSFAGTMVLMAVGLPILIFFLIIAIINILQAKFPRALPPCLRTWNWLPRFAHSLEPWDRLFGICGRQCPGFTNVFPCCRNVAETKPVAKGLAGPHDSRRTLLSKSGTASAFSSRASSPHRKREANGHANKSIPRCSESVDRLAEK